MIACILVMFVILCVGYALDRCLWYVIHQPNSLVRLAAAPEKSTRPSYLCIATLIGSYGLLLPGLKPHFDLDLYLAFSFELMSNSPPRWLFCSSY